ncbi:MAG: AAA family ATPase [Anaerolineales bacterium]
MLPMFKFYFFGQFEIWRGSEALSRLATQKTQSLLAYLIVHLQQFHSRQKLATLFWGEYDETHALHSLATSLWRIRKLLGEQALLSDVATVQFNPQLPIWLDFVEFEKLIWQAKRVESNSRHDAITLLEKAVGLYRGDFLAEFYDDWCLDQRYRLESLYLQALRRLIVAHEEADNRAEMLNYTLAYLAHDPLNEEIHLSAMRAYMRQGDVLGARRQWERCCQVCQAELHLLPSPALIEKAKGILGDQFVFPQQTQTLSPQAGPRPGFLERSPFVGRADEMRRLSTLWEQALAGKGNTVFLVGEAGVGKTRLAEEFSTLVRCKGGSIVYGNCYQPERELPLQPIRELVQGLVASDLAVLQEIPQWERKELARLLPQIEHPTPKSEFSLTQLQPERQAILFQAIVSLLHHVARRIPLLLIVEDLHWAADTTISAVHYVARQSASLPVMVLGTFRHEEIEQAARLGNLVVQLIRAEKAQVLWVDRLSREAISELVQRMSRVDLTPQEVERLYAYTEGSAFYTLEILRTLGETDQKQDTFPISQNVQTLIQARLAQLSPLASKLVVTAAVAGRRFDFEPIRAAIDLSEEEVLEGMEELIRRGFVREASSTVKADYEFIHHIVQDVTYRTIHHRRRKSLHGRVGEALETLLPNPALQAASLAFHFDAAGKLPKALHYHFLAAQRAMEVFAWGEAERHQTRVLEILDRLNSEESGVDALDLYGQVLSDQAELYYLQGELDRRDRALKTLSDLATRTQNRQLQLQALMRQTCYLNLDARYEQAIVSAEQGVALAQALGDKKAVGYLLAQLGFGYYFLGKPASALKVLEEALTLLSQDEIETRRHITHILGYVHYHLGNYAVALYYQQQAYRDHQAMSDFNGMAWAGLDIGAIFSQMGRLDEAQETIQEHLQLAQRMGACSVEAYGLNQLGILKLKQGRYADALQIFRQSLLQQEKLRTEHGRVAAHLGVGFAYYHLGEESAARRWLQMAVETARRIEHRRRLVEALIGLGLTEMVANNFDQADLCLTEAVETARDSQCFGNLTTGLVALARLSRKKGEVKTALWYAMEALQIARQLGIAVCELWAELEIGLSYLAKGEKETAQKHTQRAVDLLSRGDDGWIGREQAHQAHALVLHELGDEEEAKRQEFLAQQRIVTKAAWIEDASLQAMFLEAVNCPP